MMFSDEDKDTLWMGNIVHSFAVVVLADAKDLVSSEKRVGILFVLQNGTSKVIKLLRATATDLLSEIQRYIELTPEVTALFSGYCEATQRGISNDMANAMLESHPITVCKRSKPSDDLLRNSELATSNKYVKLIHANAYPDVYKIDCTYVDDTSDRFSFAASVVPLFQDSLQHALSQIN